MAKDKTSKAQSKKTAAAEKAPAATPAATPATPAATPPVKKKLSEEERKSAAEEYTLIQIALILCATYLYYNASNRFIAPIYGTIPTLLCHRPFGFYALAAGGAAGAVLHNLIKGNDRTKVVYSRRISLATAFLVCFSPMYYIYFFKYSQEFGPRWGPLSCLAVNLVVYFASGLLAVLNAMPNVARIEFMVAYFAYMMIPQNFYINYPSCSLIWAAASVFAMYAGFGYRDEWEYLQDNRKELRKQVPRSSLFFARERWWLWIKLGRPYVLPLFVSLGLPFILQMLLPQTATQTQSFELGRPTETKYHLLARAETSSGFVSVIEDPTKFDGLRVLRVDHSLIGSAYTSYDFETAFHSFYYMDFVRFVEREHTRHEKALAIGLGIGTSAKALMNHGVYVDVVELDKQIFQYAQEYFDFPEPSSVYFEDGRKFVEKTQADTYDYVIHDVFTGGAVPAHLFSVEALQHIKRILKSDGVLVLNFVGRFNSPATKSIAKTIKEVFPHQAVYAELTGAELQKNSQTLINMVFYASNKPIRFEAPTPADFGTSGVYAQTLATFPEHDVTSLVEVAPQPVTDKHNPLMAEQIESAYVHWHAMRDIFPQEFWIEF
ncbi:S-adenosyl-L-methionine-dependent methyltransferase [Polychytrium aggregatum]|uniref:S-adenosyl-L-methionine-dependent methyltransferase n=1 Tax=Polychytrium aggregatum TaxID=110093 RepID=UPI0022FE2FD0|nr:S-adenosyl-L-methionine-dependent methyltransferase [Polychytrium aggregatum]KAI9207034.1 S-adenosyl-L-methionine-dependent methyltransferase [Polychytrium aggregatum]